MADPFDEFVDPGRASSPLTGRSTSASPSRGTMRFTPARLLARLGLRAQGASAEYTQFMELLTAQQKQAPHLFALLGEALTQSGSSETQAVQTQPEPTGDAAVDALRAQLHDIKAERVMLEVNLGPAFVDLLLIYA